MCENVEAKTKIRDIHKIRKMTWRKRKRKSYINKNILKTMSKKRTERKGNKNFSIFDDVDDDNGMFSQCMEMCMLTEHEI
jgi:hypothetical protein